MQADNERRSAAREQDHAGRRLRQAEMLLSVDRRLSALDTLDQTLHLLLEIMAGETGAELGSIFLNDPATGELFSRVLHGSHTREIRVLNTEGISGRVFQTGETLLIQDAYASEYFNPAVDMSTGLVTRNILAVPIRKSSGQVIGVCEVINKKHGAFTRENAELLEALATQAAESLASARYTERMERSRRQELEFLDVVADITAEIDLSSVLRKVMRETTRLLDAERSTLFLNDEKTGELWSEIGEGLESSQIRIPNTVGIAGAVFGSGETINIPHAYADLRFNPAVDRQTGFFTRSILCVPVVNKAGKTIGVTQVLNKRGGSFSEEDESRLKAFSAQVSIGLENAQLFKQVQSMKNYNESMLESMSNGVLTLDGEGRVVTCNLAAPRILGLSAQQLLDHNSAELFRAPNDWVQARIERVADTGTPEIVMDAELRFGEEPVALNLSVQPLRDAEQKRIGLMLMMEDITSEKRVKATMSRYMDPAVADQLLMRGQDVLGGRSTEATVLFSDLRGFTTLSERLGASGIVSLLNEYFTLMVECIQREDGMLDKFIGDAIMAAFGIPLPHEDDADRAVRSSIAMIRTLDQWNRQRGSEPLGMGIGLNTDFVVSGNIGSPRRMDFTIIGDGVNLASRLESACKQYDARILLSENTRLKLRGTYRLREVDRVVVKGKTEPVSIHEVLDHHDETTFPGLMEAVAHFKEAQDHYRRGDWARARRGFEEALRINPADRLPQLYLERCAQLEARPPDPGWDGVWVMSSK
jgi:adenylate cyclase